MRYLSFMLLSLSISTLSAQTEIDIFRMEYLSNGASSIENNKYSMLNDITASTKVYHISLNYGHPVGNKRITALYNLDFQNFKQKLNLSRVTEDTVFQTIPKRYYSQPHFSLLSLSGGLTSTFRNNWTGYGLFSFNLTGDLFHSELSTNFTWGNMTYLEKEVRAGLSYGFGIFVNQLENRLLVAPVVNFKIKNEKRGFEILFPERIRFWQTIKKAGYLELLASSNSYSLNYQSKNAVSGTDIYIIKAGIAYNYLWQDFLKLFIRVDLPYFNFSISTNKENFNYIQQDNVGLALGFSIFLLND